MLLGTVDVTVVTLPGSKDGRSILHPKETTKTTYAVMEVVFNLRADRRHFFRNPAPARGSQRFGVRFFG
jgi:hypothetical protein